MKREDYAIIFYSISIFVFLCLFAFDVYSKNSSKLKYHKVEVVYSDGYTKDTLMLRKNPKIDLWEISEYGSPKKVKEDQILVELFMIREIE